MKLQVLLFTLFVMVVLAGCDRAGNADQNAAPSSPWIAVARGQVGVEGGLLQVRPAVPGLVSAVTVSDNDAVKPGQILVRLDDGAARIAVQLAAADLAQARAQQAELAARRPGPCCAHDRSRPAQPWRTA